MLKALFMITMCQQRLYLPQVAVIKYARTISNLSISSNHKYIYLAILWYSSFDEEL